MRRSHRRKMRPTYRHWRCPRCGATYHGTLPVLEAVCQRVSKHSTKATVAMKPVKEDT